jgi:hypothetical protein
MRTLVLVLAMTLTGCGAFTPISYVPVVPAPTADGYDLASPYPIGSPASGTVEVVAFEGKRLPVGWQRPALYLHLRLAGQNRGDAVTWRFNPNDQFLFYEDTMVRPAFARTSAGTPVLALARGEQGWIDLYYPLPDDGDPAAATLWWRVHRGPELVGQRTDLALVSGRERRIYHDDDEPIGGTPGSVSMALGWWWPGPCFRARAGFASAGASWRWSRTGVWGRRGGGERGGSADSDSSSGSSGSSGSSSSETASNWRDPAAQDPAPPSSDSSKSAWRR